jgi:hypothetical protein
LRGFQSRFQMPAYGEGFDALFHVKIGENREFIVTEWKE